MYYVYKSDENSVFTLIGGLTVSTDTTGYSRVVSPYVVVDIDHTPKLHLESPESVGYSSRAQAMIATARTLSEISTPYVLYETPAGLRVIFDIIHKPGTEWEPLYQVLNGDQAYLKASIKRGEWMLRVSRKVERGDTWTANRVDLGNRKLSDDFRLFLYNLDKAVETFQ